MAAIKIRWSVPELANVMSKFDVQKVYRSTAGPTGPWTEITTPPTRVVLVTGVENYLYDDMAGDVSYYYAMSYYNTATTEESNLSEPIRPELAGYISIEDVREQGFQDPPYSDAQVIAAIEMATALIDKVTGQWFEPRTRTFKLDGRWDSRGVRFLLNHPIIAITKLTITDDEQDLTNYVIYNRHLTEGLERPNDRANPLISFDISEGFIPGVTVAEGQVFFEGTQNIEIEGVFGWTELAPNDPVGETAPDSQVPMSYGRTPPMIKRAALMLVADLIEPIADSGGGPGVAGAIVKEKTRDQEVQYYAGASAAVSANSLTGNPRVDAILGAYRAPVGMGAV